MSVPHSLFPEPGTVTLDEATCTQCGQCAAICPTETLVMREGCLCVDTAATFGCIACGHCMLTCPTGSVKVSGRGLRPEDILPLPAPEQKASADSLEALLLSRRSVRYFQDRPVERGLIERVIRMGTAGPMGIPPWDVGVTVVDGAEKVRELAGEVIQGYKGFLKMFKPWVIGLMRPFLGKAACEQFRDFILPLARTYIEHWEKGRDVVFYGAPALLIFHHSPFAAVEDATIACTQAMLAAEALGLGTTMIGGAPPILQRNKALCKRLGIPEGGKPVLILILGWPATHFRRAVRRSFNSVNWNE
ncbi:nitroreductase family protein [bacterium]|nr:nitroreductase family protein [bacterium]